MDNNNNDQRYQKDLFMPEQMGSQETGSKSDMGLALAVLAGFILVLIAFVFKQAWLAALGMGVVFVVCAVPLLKEELKKEKKDLGFYLLFVGIGTLLSLFGILSQFGPDSLKRWGEEHAAQLLCSIFIIVGAVIMLSGFYENFRKKKYCTQMVEANCVALKSSRSSSTTTYAPVYQYYFQGEIREISSGEYTNFGNPSIGEKRQIYIDPVYLDEYYEPLRMKKSIIFRVVFGGFFLLMGAIALYCVSLI